MESGIHTQRRPTLFIQRIIRGLHCVPQCFFQHRMDVPVCEVHARVLHRNAHAPWRRCPRNMCVIAYLRHSTCTSHERGSLAGYCAGALWLVLMGMECRLMCMVRRMIGAQVYSVVRWLFGCGLVVGDFDCVIVPGLCCQAFVAFVAFSV